MKDDSIFSTSEFIEAFKHFRFIVGETLVDESKGHISAEDAIYKIRKEFVELDHKIL